MWVELRQGAARNLSQTRWFRRHSELDKYSTFQTVLYAELYGLTCSLAHNCAECFGFGKAKRLASLFQTTCLARVTNPRSLPTKLQTTCLTSFMA